MLFGRGRDGGGGSVTSADPFPLPVQLVPINPACCRRCELRRARPPPNLRPASPRVPSLLPKPKTICTSAQTQNLSSSLSPNLPLLGHKVAAVPFASTIISRLPICSPGPLHLCRGRLPNCFNHRHVQCPRHGHRVDGGTIKGLEAGGSHDMGKYKCSSICVSFPAGLVQALRDAR